MRKIIKLSLADIIDDSFESDERQTAKQYVGQYKIKTMSFGQKNEAQFKAVEVNPAFPQASKLDPWKFRFFSLLFSIEEAPGFGERPPAGYDHKKLKELELYIYHAPASVGEKLMDLSDEVNKFTEDDQKN